MAFYVTEANNSLHKTYISIVVILFTDFRECFPEKISKFGCYCSKNYIKLVRIISIAEIIEIGDIFRDEMKPSLYFHEHKKEDGLKFQETEAVVLKSSVKKVFSKFSQNSQENTYVGISF